MLCCERASFIKQVLSDSRKLCIMNLTVNEYLRTWSVAVYFIALGACQAQRPAQQLHADPVAASADAIPVAPLSGTINAKPFALQSARYFIDRRLGFEHIDVKLSAGKSVRPCSSPVPDNAPSVWLRRTGSERLDADTVRVESAKPGAWEVHYQFQQDEEWLGNGDAEALLVLHPLTADKRLHGELSACFADVSKSCVVGAFTADYCPISIDAPIRGMDLMEPPAAHGTEAPPAAHGTAVPPAVEPQPLLQGGAQ